MSKCATCPKFLSGVCSGKPQPVARALATQVQDLRRDKREGDISSTFTTFSGRKPEPLPPRFRDLKVNLTSGFEEAIQKSWDKLIETLKVKTEEVATQREKVGELAGTLLTLQMIPIADFKDVAAGTVPAETEAAVRRTGVMVVRNVMPEKEVNGLLSDAREYFAANPFRGFPSDEAQKVNAVKPVDDTYVRWCTSPTGVTLKYALVHTRTCSPHSGTCCVTTTLQPNSEVCTMFAFEDANL